MRLEQIQPKKRGINNNNRAYVCMCKIFAHCTVRMRVCEEKVLVRVCVQTHRHKHEYQDTRAHIHEPHTHA